jgi:hypothetical protein
LTTSRADPNDALSLSEEPMYADGGGVFLFIYHSPYPSLIIRQ